MNNFIKMLLISFFMLGAAKADDNEELPSGLNEFFLNAIEAAETRNFDWLSEHTAFPFCLMKGNTRINVKSKDDFKENSEIIFTPDFIDELKKSKGTPIFNNWQGYMVANGRLWADGGFGEFELTKINSPNVMRCYQGK